MKWISIATVLLVLVSVESTAQITIKTEYFGTSAYRDEHNQKVGSSKGSAMVYHGSANLPLSMKKNESNQPTIWGIGLSGDYASQNLPIFAPGTKMKLQARGFEMVCAFVPGFIPNA